MLEFVAPADPAHVRLPADGLDQFAGHYGSWLLAALRHIHSVGAKGRRAFVQVPQYPHGVGTHPATHILSRFPHVMVEQWEPTADPNPMVTAVYRLAPHPLAPHTRVTFTIGYLEAVDGTVNALCYRIAGTEEEQGEAYRRL